MKYEMIFGDEKLFAGVPEYVEFIRYNSYSRDYLWGDLNVIHHLTFKDLTALPIVAMRRIIQEPKRWTIEDQKAGRLPEVGCMVMVPSVGECASVAAINNDAVCVVFHDGGFITLHKSGISPIETPEGKAERLRSEWIELARNKYANDLNCNSFSFVYDSIISGELPVPTKGGE